MAEFIFTGPDGTKYYAQGDDPADAFSGARPISDSDIAALSARRVATSPTAQMGREIEKGQEFQQSLERTREQFGREAAPRIAEMAIPPLAVARHLKSGEYGEAAEDAALQALPLTRFLPKQVVKPALAAGGAALGFTSPGIGGDDPLAFIKETQDREAARAAMNKLRGEDRAETGRLRAEYIDKLRKEYQGRADTETARVRKLAAEGKAVEDFNKRNAAMIETLSADQKNQLANREVPGDVMATIKNKGEYLDTIAKQRERETMGFSQRNPEAMEWIQKGSYLASAGIPMYQLWAKAANTARAAKEAEKAYIAAIKGGGKDRPAEELLSLRSNQLSALNADRGVGWGTVLGAPAIPLAAAEAPNLIDLAQLQSHPESEAYKHAWKMVNPWAGEEAWYDSPAFQTALRALEEGGQATAAGLAIGEPLALMRGGRRVGSAGGTLKTIRDREARMSSDELKADYIQKATEAKEAQREVIEATQEAPRESPLAPSSALSPQPRTPPDPSKMPGWYGGYRDPGYRNPLSNSSLFGDIADRAGGG